MSQSAWLAATGLLSAMLSAPVAAQTQPAQPASASDDKAGLQDIVVTAQRRSESLQRAAVAVTAISGDLLTSAGITRPTELTSLIPSLQVAPSAGPYNLFYLRGVGNFQGNALSESAIAFTFNNVYIGRPSGTTGFFYDLERVEVVKGPQGTGVCSDEAGGPSSHEFGCGSGPPGGYCCRFRFGDHRWGAHYSASPIQRPSGYAV